MATTTAANTPLLHSEFHTNSHQEILYVPANIRW